jgi:hypothetical protein
LELFNQLNKRLPKFKIKQKMKHFLQQQQEKFPAFFTKEVQEKMEKINTFDKSKITVEDVKEVVVKGKPNVIIRNILSKEECDLLIQETEKSGYEEAEKFCFSLNIYSLTTKVYRDRLNDRMMSDDVEFSKFIWERVKGTLPETYIHQGVEWKMDDLNPRWRFCKYQKGVKFIFLIKKDTFLGLTPMVPFQRIKIEEVF